MESRGQPTFLEAWLDGDHVVVNCHFMMSALVKQIPGAEWVYAERHWHLPANLTTLEALRGVRGAQIDGAIAQHIGADVEPSPDPIPEDLDGIIAKMPVKVRPYAHQAAAFKRAMEVFE